MRVSPPAFVGLCLGWLVLSFAAGVAAGAPFGHMAIVIWLPAAYFGLCAGVIHCILVWTLRAELVQRFLTTLISSCMGGVLAYALSSWHFSISPSSGGLMLVGLVAAFAAVAPWVIHYVVLPFLVRKPQAPSSPNAT